MIPLIRISVDLNDHFICSSRFDVVFILFQTTNREHTNNDIRARTSCITGDIT